MAGAQYLTVALILAAGALLAFLALLAKSALSEARRRGEVAQAKEKWFLPKGVAAQKRRPGAPISGTCAFCAERASMPFRCKFCGKVHCERHKMPENHTCPGLLGLRREGAR